MKGRFVRALLIGVLMLIVFVGVVSAASPGQVEEPEFQFTVELIGALAGVAVSLMFSYFPVLRVKYAALSQEIKSFVMIGLMAVIVIVITVLDYFEIVNAGLTFDKSGITRIVMTFLAALVANQSTYQISPQLQEVKYAKFYSAYPE